QAGGADLDGLPGTPMFTAGDPPTEITLALTDPRGVAAAAVGEGTRGNGKLGLLATLPADENSDGSRDGRITGTAAALAARTNVAAAPSSLPAAAVAAREEVAGVDLDASAVELTRFHHAYQASSRVIQVARDLLQSI